MTAARTRTVEADPDATLSLLWERMCRQGDMPGFARAIGAILGAMRGEDEHAFSLTQTVLSDPILTQKVLRLANSGMYAAFGQRINTVSKAVLVLGQEAIGHLALGLKLVEELGANAPAGKNAQVEMEKAVLAGMVAQQVAAGAEGRDTEEAVVCAMLHSLGRMAVTFYLPEQWSALQRAAGADAKYGADNGVDDGAIDRVAAGLLGLSLEDVGRAAAERWGLPHNLIASMRRIEPGTRPEAFGHGDWLAALSTMSTRCADSLWEDDCAGARALPALAAGFSAMLGVSSASITLAVDKARASALADLAVAPFACAARERAQAALAPLAAAQPSVHGPRLLSGLADMRDAAAGAHPGQMMSMALETVYQGMGLSRAVAFLRNRSEHTYAAKLGFGPGVRPLLPSMTFDDRFQPNVFHAALNYDRIIFIENAADPDFTDKLPEWWQASLSGALSFIILPLCRHGQAVGFIYGDWDDALPHAQPGANEFDLLNELRALVVDSVDRRQRLEAELPLKVC